MSDTCWPGDREGNFTCGLGKLENSVDRGSSPPLTQDFWTQYMPGRNAVSGNCQTGQLVPEGLRMQVNNGRRLREAYAVREKLLPESLQDMDAEGMDATFFLRSTDIPRTRQSGMALFSGLYQDHRQARPPYLRLHTMDVTEENMFFNQKTCPALQLARDNFYRTHPAAEALEGLCKELGKSVDGSPASRHECQGFLEHQVDCLMSRMCPTVPFHPRNATIPPKFLKDDAALLRRLWRTLDTTLFAYFHALRRPGIGPFVGEVLAAASAAVEGRQEARPFMLWSGHDDGPMEPLWAAFELREGPPYWPPFASMLVLEVWSSPSGPLVRWVSNGAVAGGGPRPWAEFAARAEALVPTEAECQASLPEAPMMENNGRLARVLAIIAPALVGAALALLSVAACRRRPPGSFGGENIKKRCSSSGSSLLENDSLGA